MAASYYHPDVKTAVETARKAIEIDQRPHDWFVYKTKEGKFGIECSATMLAAELRKGAEIVGIVDGILACFREAEYIETHEAA